MRSSLQHALSQPLVSGGLLMVGLLLGCSRPVMARERCSRPEIHIYKQRGELVLRCTGKQRHRFPVSFGGSPLGNKTRSGDERTPEGRYRVCGKHLSKRFYRFIDIDYPGREDAQQAHRQGRITRDQLLAINAAHDAGRCPPFSTPLGGAIGIHGWASSLHWAVGLWNRLSRIGGLYRRIGFSEGCIVATNEDIDRIWPLVRQGTPVFIHGVGAAARM